MNNCPICQYPTSPTRLEIALDKNANLTEIFQCRACLAILNGRAYSMLEVKDVTEIQRTDFYISKFPTKEEISSEIEKCQNIMNHLYLRIDRDWSKLTFCDFGGGAGYAAIAATKRFNRAVLCEYDTRSVMEVCSTFGAPKNLQIVDDIEKINQKIDVMFMWHVLEHIPNPRALLSEMSKHLSGNAIFFLQCPGYRKEYVVDCHYSFFNEPSLTQLFEEHGIQIVEIGHDTENAFISFLGERRPKKVASLII